MSIYVVHSWFFVNILNALSTNVAPNLTTIVSGHVSTGIVFYSFCSAFRTAGLDSILYDIIKSILHCLEFQTSEVPFYVLLYFLNIRFIVVVVLLEFLDFIVTDRTVSLYTTLAVEKI